MKCISTKRFTNLPCISEINLLSFIFFDYFSFKWSKQRPLLDISGTPGTYNRQTDRHEGLWSELGTVPITLHCTHLLTSGRPWRALALSPLGPWCGQGYFHTPWCPLVTSSWNRRHQAISNSGYKRPWPLSNTLPYNTQYKAINSAVWWIFVRIHNLTIFSLSPLSLSPLSLSFSLSLSLEKFKTLMYSK